MANTTNNTKTQKDYFNEIIALAEDNDRLDLVKFAKGRIEQLDKKKSSKTKKGNPEMDRDKSLIIDYLTSNPSGATCSDLIKNITEFEGYSTSKCSSRTKALVDSGVLVKNTVKGKSVFTIA